jgi:hypothetical protein
MSSMGTRATWQRHRRDILLPGGAVFKKGEWMHGGQDAERAPTVFLVEQPPDYSVPPHFHRQNEFQVVVQGAGSMGRHPIRPITVHYAGAYTGYGPRASGADGLFYFPLRPAFDAGPLYVDGNRDQLLRGPKRQLHSTPYAPLAPDGLAQILGLETFELIPEQADGIFCRRYLIPAGAEARTPSPADGGGQFVMVITGSIRLDDTELTRWETLHVAPEEPSIAIRAGAQGAEVLLMQLAPTAPEYRAARAD